jgi:hypothetical protein
MPDATTAEASPVVDASPVVGATPVVDATPVVGATPVVDATPVVGATPVVHASPTVDVLPAVDTSPLVDAYPSFDASPATGEPLTLDLDGFELEESTLVNSRILPYVRMVVSVLEGRRVSHEQLLVALRTRIRQRSLGRLSRREYVRRYLNQHPP